MKNQIIELISNKLENLNVWIDDVYIDKESDNTYLHIVLDANFIIPIDIIVEATKIIDPLLEKINIINDTYILDIYAKSKGDGSDE